jgi:hypothetical protein
MLYEYGTKWLELLKEIAPGVKQVAFLQALGALAGPGQFGAMQSSAPSLGVEVRPIRVGDAGESRPRHHGIRDSYILMAHYLNRQNRVEGTGQR